MSEPTLYGYTYETTPDALAKMQLSDQAIESFLIGRWLARARDHAHALTQMPVVRWEPHYHQPDPMFDSPGEWVVLIHIEGYVT